MPIEPAIDIKEKGIYFMKQLSGKFIITITIIVIIFKFAIFEKA